MDSNLGTSKRLSISKPTEQRVPRLVTLGNDDRKSRFAAVVTVSEAAKAAIAKRPT